MAHSNLTLDRGPSIWKQQARAAHTRDTAERALLGGTGLVLLLIGLRGRTTGRVAAAAAGASLLALAGSPRGLARLRAWGDRQRWRWTRHDEVNDQSDQSFPASDSPTWTSVTGGGTADRTLHG
jgi:hypothetical protein